ncbi:putative efflux protein, MATE family [Haladaptatus litoreus]|uniref:Putative efflux protein, MATE family n=1 Tax=Haladaptatus litoreus TaxID=553468 RepID=A0A1N6VG53_9EURY|nr:MATE family efflux transporter [Haladaptatus litoreus]SIQ76767.1 putative efflux protein, MATE family [Haladaptatus litoreus]
MPSTRSASGLTEGSLVGPMVKLAWPIVVIQLLQVTYNIADTFWLGALSSDAVGALSLAFPLIFFLISVGGGFTIAGSILVAQHTGAGGDEEASAVAGQTLSFVSIMAVGIAVVGYFLVDPMLSLLPADERTAAVIIPMAADYMRVFFLGAPFLFGFFVFSALMQGYGETKPPMRIMAVSVLINVVLDPIFIFGLGPIPGMEIEGAAIATVLSRGLATILGLYVIFGTDTGPQVELHHLKPDFDRIREIVKLGVPTAAEQSTSSMAMVILTGMVATFPPAVVAAYGLGNRLSSLVFLPAMGLGQATNTMVGQNLGAKRPDRAERSVRLAGGLVAGVMFVVALVAFFVPEPLVSVFLSADEPRVAETIKHGSDYLRIMAPMFVFMGVLQVILGAFRGAGNTRTALVFSMLTLWVARVPATYYLVFVEGWGPTGIWVAVALGDIVGAIAAVAWFLRGTWKMSVVVNTETEPTLGD